MGTRNEWNPFQKFPTNMLQFVIDFIPALFRSELVLNLLKILNEHNEIFQYGIGLDTFFEMAGMAQNKSIYR